MAQHFKDDRESVESDPHSGRPATNRTPENVERVRAAINQDWQLAVRELGAALGIPNTTASDIMTQDLGVKHVVAKFTLQLLLAEQKEHHTAVPNDLIQTATNEPDFLKKVLTLKGPEVSLSCVQCFWYLLSSINIYYSHYMLDNFLDRPCIFTSAKENLINNGKSI